MKKIILDTDMGCDCDDAAALAILLRAVKNKEAELSAVTHAIDNVYGLRFIENMIKEYGLKDIPVCRCSKSGFMDSEQYNTFIKPLSEGADNSEYPDSVKTMRKILSENDSVTIVTIGSFVNLAGLLKSQPDEISGLSGTELVHTKTDRVYSMAGNFKNQSHCEFNIVCDIESAKYTAEHCPCEIVYCGFEIGEKIITGASLDGCPDGSLAKQAFRLYTGRLSRPSWDPCTAYQAIYPENRLFSLSDGVSVNFSDKGETIFSPGGKDRYMLMRADTALIEKTLNGLMC